VLVGKAELVTASPKGGVAPLDQGSVEAFKEDESSVNFVKNHKDVWEKTLPLSQFVGKAAEFDAVFYPGGHGPLFDLVDDADSIKVIEEFYAAGKVVSAVCHGPIVFANTKTPDGKPIVSGRTVTGFTEAEEKLAGLTDAVPFSLEEKLKPAGANWVQADEPFQSKVVTDGKLITGQNPQSAKGVGEALAKALG
jgi:putative intracellular protease/amidase